MNRAFLALGLISVTALTGCDALTQKPEAAPLQPVKSILGQSQRDLTQGLKWKPTCAPATLETVDVYRCFYRERKLVVDFVHDVAVAVSYLRPDGLRIEDDITAHIGLPSRKPEFVAENGTRIWRGVDGLYKVEAKPLVKFHGETKPLRGVSAVPFVDEIIVQAYTPEQLKPAK